MAEKSRVLLTPFLKQCYVTAGVALNMAQLGLAMGIASTMVPQLKEPSSLIPIDDESGSWIASIPGITYLIGNLCIPKIMETFGRKPANLCSLVVAALSWTSITFSPNFTTLLIARGLQGIGMGMTSVLSPVLIGEYASPKNRGALLMTISITIGGGVLSIHAMGLYLYWKTVALICIGFTVVDIVIVVFSPESPSWLAVHGKHDQCIKTFRWLRGDAEEEELSKLLETNPIKENNSDKDADKRTIAVQIKNKVIYLTDVIRRKEFYKPIIIMGHIYALGQWSGINIFASYAVDLIRNTISEDVDISAMLIGLDTQRIISTTLALIIIKNMKRRNMFIMTIGLNLIVVFVTALYVYVRENNFLSYDSMYIGIFLIHVHMFSIAIGALPMGFILAGELFPLEFRSVAGGISAILFSLNSFAAVKTVPLMLKTLGLHGMYFVYCGLLIYCFVVVYVMLPETKDKTLQDIEDELKGSKKTKGHIKDKCSAEHDSMEMERGHKKI